jgi:hypothetical protein
LTNLALRTMMYSLGLQHEYIDIILLRHRGTSCSYLHELIGVRPMVGVDDVPLDSHLCVLREIQEHELKYIYSCVYIDRRWDVQSGELYE